MRRASLSRERGLVAPKARGGKTRGLNAPDDMAILRIELEDIEPLIWRRVAVPVSMNLEVVHSLIQAAVRWLIQSALITLIRLRLRSPQPAASGQRPERLGAQLVCRAELADNNRLFLVGPFAHIRAKSCGPGLYARTVAPAIWLVAATMRRCHIPAMHCCFGELANGRIRQSTCCVF